jgi:hypothetical protein
MPLAPILLRLHPSSLLLRHHPPPAVPILVPCIKPARSDRRSDLRLWPWVRCNQTRSCAIVAAAAAVVVVTYCPFVAFSLYPTPLVLGTSRTTRSALYLPSAVPSVPPCRSSSSILHSALHSPACTPSPIIRPPRPACQVTVHREIEKSRSDISNWSTAAD